MKYIPYAHQQIESDDIREVVKVLKSDWITQGPKVKEFEDSLCEYTGAKYAVAVSSGTAALHIASLAAGIKKGDEVITSPITFAASANSVLYCGGRPVFADIQKDTANIDPEKIKKRITKKTKAIISIHFAGHPVDSEEIHNIARRHNLTVIEDAAHALGAEYKFKPKGNRSSRWAKVGSCRHSDMAIFSFHPAKSITTGEGGAVLTNKKDLYEKLLMLRSHGITKDDSRFTLARRSLGKGGIYDSQIVGPWYYEQQYLGFNYRITDFQCVLGINQLRKLNKFIRRRREIVKIYNKALSEIDQIELPVEKEYVKSSWHLYPIRLKEPYVRKRIEIFNTLRTRGVGVQIHYLPVYLHPYYKRLGYRKGLCPKAEDFYQREISLPLYPAMKESEITYVTKTLIEVFKKYD